MTEAKQQAQSSTAIPAPRHLPAEYPDDGIFRILSLDGGGAKGFYTLGVFREIEAMLKCPLYKRFNLVYGTSTGSIIAALIALGFDIEQIHSLYKENIIKVTKAWTAKGRSKALAQLATTVFGEKNFTDVKTGIGVVATRWIAETPMIFKGNAMQAHGRSATFSPGFGVSISEAVQASCSAFPFFRRKFVTTSSGDLVELFDGGFCANNPTLYALADALIAMGKQPESVRVVSIGVGVYPQPKRVFIKRLAMRYFKYLQLLQKTLEVNTHSMDQLRIVLFKDIPTVRVSDTFERPEMATDFMECNMDKLNLLRQRGSESFASREAQLRTYLL